MAASCSEISTSKGKQDELLQVYRKAVISGFADVENALDKYRKTAERKAIQRDVVRHLVFDISEQRLVKAPSTWSPCCKHNRRSTLPKMCWFKRGLPTSRQSSASIRRSVAVGIRNPW